MKLSQSDIDNNYKILIDWIETIPVSDKGKSFLKSLCYKNFYDSWILLNEKDDLEDLEVEEINIGLYTYGIKTKSQFNDFRNYFFENIKKSRLKAIVKWSEDLKIKNPDDAQKIIDSHIYKINKIELLSEIGGQTLNEWQMWLRRFLENEKSVFPKELDHKRPEEKPKPSFYDYFYENINTEHQEYIKKQLSKSINEYPELGKLIGTLIRYGYIKDNKHTYSRKGFVKILYDTNYTDKIYDNLKTNIRSFSEGSCFSVDSYNNEEVKKLMINVDDLNPQKSPQPEGINGK